MCNSETSKLTTVLKKEIILIPLKKIPLTSNLLETKIQADIRPFRHDPDHYSAHSAGPILSSTHAPGRQVAAESHEAAAADGPGVLCSTIEMSVTFIPCQLHLSVTSRDIQISESSKGQHHDGDNKKTKKNKERKKKDEK